MEKSMENEMETGSFIAILIWIWVEFFKDRTRNRQFERTAAFMQPFPQFQLGLPTLMSFAYS